MHRMRDVKVRVKCTSFSCDYHIIIINIIIIAVSDTAVVVMAQLHN